MSASLASAGSFSSSLYLRTIASKLHSSPWCPSSASGMSYGVAPSRSATDSTWSLGAYKNSALGSTKRLISQGQAMRSTLGRSRVTHFIVGLLPLLPVCHTLVIDASNTRHNHTVAGTCSPLEGARLGSPCDSDIRRM